MQPAGCEQCPSRDDVAKKERLVHLRGKINETVTVRGVESISPVTNQKHQQDIRKGKLSRIWQGKELGFGSGILSPTA